MILGGTHRLAILYTTAYHESLRAHVQGRLHRCRVHVRLEGSVSGAWVILQHTLRDNTIYEASVE